ncbi:MAG TPA: TIGR02444 family protein [Halomonas sp.]|nr:TIGR02444 family protein [Halomonas sp.]
MRSKLADRPLWEFALALYARPGVEAACLRLQDSAGLDVCELLWLCWLARHGLAPADDVGQHLEPVRAWQRDMTYPLRRQRRALKARVGSVPELARLRQAIKEAELLAEREALRQLQELARQGLGVRPLKLGDAPWTSCMAKRAQGDARSVRHDLDTLAKQLRSA